MDYKIVDTTPIEGLRRVMANNKYGIINRNNNLVCEMIYDAIDLDVLLTDEKTHPDKRIKVSQNGLKGFVDINGKQVIFPQFYDAERFDNRYAKVTYQNKDFYNREYCDLIDRAGNTLRLSRMGRYCEDIKLYGSRQQYALLTSWFFYSGKLMYRWDFDDLEFEYRGTPRFIEEITKFIKTTVMIEPVSPTRIKIMSETNDYLVDVPTEKVLDVRRLSLMEKIKRMSSDKGSWK
jgi:hypothetical protein